MKNIWLLMKTNLKRNKLAVMLSIFGAAALCSLLFAMGTMATDISLSKVRVGVIDQDQSSLSKDFKKYLSTDLEYELVESMDFDYLSGELIDKNISVIIEIPEGFYGSAASASLKDITITSLDDYENAAFLEAYLNSYLGSIHMLSVSSDKSPEVFGQLLSDFKQEIIPITQEVAEDIDQEQLKERAGFINSIGFYMMIVFGLGLFLSFMILDDRLSGVFKRIQITPVKPVQYMIGSGIFGILLCLLGVWIYCAFIKLVRIDIGLPIGVVFWNMSIISLFTVFFSMALAMALRSRGALSAAIIGFCTIGAILGGAYFPLELAPKNLQNLARVLPQYWFMETFRQLQSDPTAVILPNFIILGLFTLLAFLIGAVLFSQNNKNS